jgi:NADP-dependent 3-hydroxy acid dehydrogenase YdfG
MSKKIISITGASTGFGNLIAKVLAESEHTAYLQCEILMALKK